MMGNLTIIAVGKSLGGGEFEMDVALPAVEPSDFEQGKADFWRGVCRVGASADYLSGWDLEADAAYAELCEERADAYQKYTSWLWA